MEEATLEAQDEHELPDVGAVGLRATIIEL
jgi:hypothetical protein